MATLQANLGLRKLALLAATLNEQQPESVIITSSTLAEAYVDEILRRLVELRSKAYGAFELLMVKEVRDRFYVSWDERLKWLTKGFQVGSQGSRVVQELRLLVELRNSIIHGGGALTQMQTGKLQAQLALERDLRRVLSVEVEGGRVAMGSDTPRLAVLIARAFILDLDSAARLQLAP